MLEGKDLVNNRCQYIDKIQDKNSFNDASKLF